MNFREETFILYVKVENRMVPVAQLTEKEICTFAGQILGEKVIDPSVAADTIRANEYFVLVRWKDIEEFLDVAHLKESIPIV